jgi:hypothetical protein
MAEFTPLPPLQAHSGAFVNTRASDAGHVVLLLGWADGPLEYVQNYAAIYGNARVVVQLSQFKLFVYTDAALLNMMLPVVEWLKEQKVDNQSGLSPPLIVHLFSNGGALLLCALQLAADRARLKLDIKGIICDSAPSKGRLVEGVKVGTMWVQNPVLRCIASPLVVLMMVASRLVAIAQCKASRFQWIWTTLANPEYKCPRLMLYSEADTLTEVDAVELFIAAARQKGIDVVTKRWQHSTHVRHFPQYPVEYRSLIHQHILQPALNVSSTRST